MVTMMGIPTKLVDVKPVIGRIILINNYLSGIGAVGRGPFQGTGMSSVRFEEQAVPTYRILARSFR
jgi:hypothetical protein